MQFPFLVLLTYTTENNSFAYMAENYDNRIFLYVLYFVFCNFRNIKIQQKLKNLNFTHSATLGHLGGIRDPFPVSPQLGRRVKVWSALVKIAGTNPKGGILSACECVNSLPVMRLRIQYSINFPAAGIEPGSLHLT